MSASRRLSVPIIGGMIIALAAGLWAVTGIWAGTTIPARAAGDLQTIYINSNAFGKGADQTGGGCVPGNDVYDDVNPAANTCTLGQALTYANLNSTAANPLTVTLATGFAAAAPAGGWEITLPTPTTALAAAAQTSVYMVPTLAVGQTSCTAAGNKANQVTTVDANTIRCGAYYLIDAPMTVDLQNKLGIVATSLTTVSVPYATIYIRGEKAPGDIKLLNASNIQNNKWASIVVGEKANDVLISGGKTMPDHDFIHTFLAINDGAQNVTFHDYTVGNLWQGRSSGCESAAVCISPGTTPNSSAVVSKNVVIDDVTFTSTEGRGYKPVVVYNQSWIDGFEIKNSRFLDLLWTGWSGGASEQYATVVDAWTQNANAFANFSFHDNVVDNVATLCAGTGANCSFIKLPGQPVGGTISIYNNTFAGPSGSATASHAISWTGSGRSGTQLSNLYIYNNTFDRFVGAAIYLDNTGLATVERNLFLPGTFSSTSTSAEETGNVAATMFANGSAANEKIRTWYPTTATVGYVNGVCSVTLKVSPPTAATIPTGPLRIDVYYTANRTAEAFLGSQDIPGVPAPTTAQTISVPLDKVIDPVTGVASGKVRVQTQARVGANGDQLESSQYSRTIDFSGSCPLKLTIDRADGMDDETRGRDLHFTLRSSAPLDPDSVTEASFDLTTKVVTDGPVQTIYPDEPELLRQRIVSITPIPGTNNKEFDIVIRVNDTADIEVAVGPGKVATPQGSKNTEAATIGPNEAKIRFLNPMVVDPQTFTLVTGDPDGRDYTVSIAPGAPNPADPINIVITSVTQAEDAPAISVGTIDPMPAGYASSSTTTVNVTAAAGDVDPGKQATIKMAVVSDDTNYDELIVPPVKPRLFSSDPTIAVTKTAYTDVADTSTLAGVEAGTPAVWTDTTTPRLLAGQTVCFVYTVTNTSADQEPTVLQNIAVTDSDTRLGAGGDGVIGTIPTLAIGASEKLFACVALDARDTADSASRAEGTVGP